MPSPDLATIAQNLAEDRCEIARRLCLAALPACPEADRTALLRQLHIACSALSDHQGCNRALDAMHPETIEEQLELLLRRASDFHRFSHYDYYRDSKELKQGYSGEQYLEMMQKKASHYFDEAKKIAHTLEQRKLLADILRRCRRKAEADSIYPPEAVNGTLDSPPRHGSGVLTGRLAFPDGHPVANALVTLGLQVTEAGPDPQRYRNTMQIEFRLACSPLETMTARTNVAGQYRFESVPAGCHEFLAVNLDPATYAISLRFLAHKVEVSSEGVTVRDAVVQEWQSPPPRKVVSPHPAELTHNGVRYVRIAEDILKNPFEFYFHRQALETALPAGTSSDPERLLLLSSEDRGTAYPFQLSDGNLLYFSDLPGRTDRIFAVYQADECATPSFSLPDLTLVPDADGKTAVVDTGVASLRVPHGTGTDALPPILSVKGADGVWRGTGRLMLPHDARVVRRDTTIRERGPLQLVVDVNYTLANGADYRLEMTFHRNEGYVLVHESSPDIGGAAFDFSLAEFQGGRGYLHWNEDRRSVHWTDLSKENRLLCRLEESVPWWCPPEGFGYAMTPNGLEERDFIGVFTVRRGEWIDRKFEKVAFGPGDDRRELDWPHPEMVGSTISMISAHTTPEDAFFHFGFFDGERYWGMLVSTVDANDGYSKEISAVQHKNSSPRLQEFKAWELDRRDTAPRPALIDKESLPELRRRKDSAQFKHIYERIAPFREDVGRQNPNAFCSFRAIIEGSPELAWFKKRELVDTAQPHSLSILLGRDYGDDYSPVAARLIAPWVEDFDIIVATGVFTPDEERLVRTHLLLLGHMYMQTDFTNWRFNARNANFEADRVDSVGVVGLCFHDSPASKAFIEHASSRLAQMLDIYCTPGSGRWYENVSCYFLQSVKCWSNLAIHMARHGHMDPARIPKMKDFLSWGINVFTPPTPAIYELMRDGLDSETYRTTAKVRRISPIGDHAHIGPWLPEHLAIMAHYFRETDPEFADFLRWGYHASGANGGYFANHPLFFSMADEIDLKPPEEPVVLQSRRLEGFGAAFRGNFNQENEFFLLLKQGPGGYRYHRTEGSIILFADGKPLIYDGGEAGETWRHTTLSFYDIHTALAPGHVERFHSFPEIDFAQGVHPVALKPGEPDFLSMDCRSELVELAIERFNEPRPADSRSVCWVKDEYVVLHDELDLDPSIPTHWHLQAVAHDETGSIADGFRFCGRFGTDFHVLLPGQEQAQAKIDYLPIVEPFRTPEEAFGMRHLQVDGLPGTDHYLALIRPLSAGKTELQAEGVQVAGRTVGIRVTGEGIQDVLLFAHKGIEYAGDGIEFTGRYGSVLIRQESTTLTLQDAGLLSVSGYKLTSTGPAASLHAAADGTISLTAEGIGEVTVTFNGGTQQITCTGERETLCFGKDFTEQNMAD